MNAYLLSNCSIIIIYEIELQVSSMIQMILTKDQSIFHEATNLYKSSFVSMDQESHFKSSCFQCLCIYHNFLYYSFTYPYKLAVNKDERKVYLVSNGLRTVIQSVSFPQKINKQMKLVQMIVHLSGSVVSDSNCNCDHYVISCE